MPFRLIKNRAQEIAVKGFVITLVLAALLPLFVKDLYFDETGPFVIVWVMVWIIGASADSKTDE